MRFVKYLVLFFLVLGVQLFLYQTQKIQFVEVSDTAKILCLSKEKLEGGWQMLWYFKRENEKPTFIKNCSDHQNLSKFVCKREAHGLTLEISNIQKNESGIYYCAFKKSKHLLFKNGSTLIIGDSYTNSSWVMLLVPFPHGIQATGTANLVCVIHGVSSPVHVSRSVSGEVQEQGLMRSVKAKDGSLTLINHISVPMDTWTSGEIFTCEVKFNASGKSVKKSARYPEDTSTAYTRICLPYIVSLGRLSALMLLTVSLSLVWTFCPSMPESQHRISEPPALQENQDGITYTQLNFDLRNCDKRPMQQPTKGKRVYP